MSESKREELKPCLLCGGKAIPTAKGGTLFICWDTDCPLHRTPMTAAAWNRRAASPEAEALVVIVARMVEECPACDGEGFVVEMGHIRSGTAKPRKYRAICSRCHDAKKAVAAYRASHPIKNR